MLRWPLAAAALATALLAGCGARPAGSTLDAGDPPPDPADEKGPAATVQMVEYEAKTQALLEATTKLGSLQADMAEQARRLLAVCADHPDHIACAAHTAASQAREAFCQEEAFTRHVDSVVRSCHQGMCKQLDQAEQITRTEYMLLTQRLPHSLVQFRVNDTNLDRRDRDQLQQFIETIGGEKGYVIIVGRASRDGAWKHNLKLAVDRAENTRQYVTEQLGLDPKRVGYITYGHDKMFLTPLDAERLSGKRLTIKQANRSALVFSYPCYQGDDGV